MSAKQKNAGNICNICLRHKGGPVGPYCNGHAKSGGGGSSGGGSGESAKESAVLSASPKHAKANHSVHYEGKQQHVLNEVLSEHGLALNPLDIKFNHDIISEMLANKLLIIDNNPELGTLRIALTNNHLTAEQSTELRKYTNAILLAFEQLKADKGIDGVKPQIQRDHQTGQITSLIIRLPTLELYNQFIAKLAALNLLPQQAMNPSKAASYSKNTNHFNPTPLSTRPEQSPHKNDDPEADKRQTQKGRKPNPFDIHSGPKPKGQ